MNLDNMLASDELDKLKSDEAKKIFFFRICGTGMGAAACILKEAGHKVEGADVSFSPPMSTYLESVKIPCHDLSIVDKEFLSKFDIIVVGNSVPKQSEHARLIESCGVPFTSFPSILGSFILKEKEVIGIAGTHGKTTTTYFLAQMLEALGEDVGYFIGGIMNDRPPAKIGGKYFVIESDEYDSSYFQKFSKFHLYELNQMILTSLEFDHADIYDSLEQIENEFERVIPRLSTVIGCADYPSIEKLSAKFQDRNWLLYGERSAQGPSSIEVKNGQTSFELVWKNEKIKFTTNIIGTHNIYNISSCIFFLLQEGFAIDRVQNACIKFSMVKRRQEVRGSYRGSIVIDDFAHHPRAVSLTIDAIKTNYPEKKIVTIFEPVSATARSNCFQSEFAQSLKSSDEVVIAKYPAPTTARGKENLDIDKLVNDLKESKTSALSVETLDSLIGKLNELADEKTLFLVLSNRNCLGLWNSEFVNEL